MPNISTCDVTQDLNHKLKHSKCFRASSSVLCQVDRSGGEQALVSGGDVRHPLLLHYRHHGLHLHVQVLHTPHRLPLQQGPAVDQPGAVRPHVLHSRHTVREAE